MTGEETTPAGFLIDGKEYPTPGLSTFDMDEAQLLWDYSGLTLDDFVAPDPEDPDVEALEAERQHKLKHPGLMRTVLHVAYQRGNPAVKPVVVKKLIGGVSLLDAMSKILESGEESDASPPDQSAMTSEPSESSPSESSETDNSTKPSPVTSGNGSSTDSDAPAETPVPTGTSPSDISAIPDPARLAV